MGRSGKLLDQLLESAGISTTEEVFICNAVKCRPPKNRRPTKREVKNSKPWLDQQIRLVDPWIVVLVGSTAVETILEVKQQISTLRGVWQTWQGRNVMPVFHPSYLLRNPSKSDGQPTALTMGDLLKVKKKLDEYKKCKNLENREIKGSN